VNESEIEGDLTGMQGNRTAGEQQLDRCQSG